MDSDLFVTSDTECSDSVAGFACRGGQERLKSAPAQEGSRERVKLTIDGRLTR